ncbi:hypothetical protein D9758_001384 [Tetrapyrgos nigripes]|uniref:Transcription factor domain-containing protein n=1 Tax=Tetrapyrgos nigripes TaxID=182062 RepID=A0A8H5GSL1_9AGAR|nr:hypothetical protein D9758_001384 [Tetrapyrgos nigripes]
MLPPANYACVLTGPKTVQIQNLPIPSVGPEDVLVQIEATGICGTDLHLYNDFGFGKFRIPGPSVLGHEAAGTIVQVGENVKDRAIGDRVCIEPTIFCRKCYNCKSGRPNICPAFKLAGLAPTPGTLSHRLHLASGHFRAGNPNPFSRMNVKHTDSSQIAKRAKFGPGQTVAVFGCGPLGALVMATAKAYGLSKVLAFDISAKRVEFVTKHYADYGALSLQKEENEDYTSWAEKFKAETMKDAGIEPWGVDIVVEASGAEACMHAGIGFLRPGGTYVAAGLGKEINTFPTVQIVTKELDVVGSVRYTVGCFQTAIDLVSSGRVDLKPLVTAQFPISRSAEALEAPHLRVMAEIYLVPNSFMGTAELRDTSFAGPSRSHTTASKHYGASGDIQELLPTVIPNPNGYSHISSQEPERQGVSGVSDERSSSFTQDVYKKNSYGSARYAGSPSSSRVDASVPKEPNTLPDSTGSVVTEIRLPSKHSMTHHASRTKDIVYPSHQQADELVARYFSEVHHTFPILHQQTFVERYMKAMKDRVLDKPSQDRAFLSLLFAVFACGACLSGKGEPRFRSESPGGQVDFNGSEFYESAQSFVWSGMGSSKLEHVQCLAILSICNATWNTLAQSWINAGAAVRRAQDLGLHRAGKRQPLSPFEREMRRRVWWCVYGLDRVLSLALGRPSGIHDDDCDVDMPAEWDDLQLTSLRDGNAVSAQETSFMTGFVALLGFYVVAGKVMRFQSKRTQGLQSEITRSTLASLDAELANWINSLPPCIQISATDDGNPKLRLQSVIASLVYHSAIINLYRPFIPGDPHTPSDLTPLVRCIGAARSFIQIGDITPQTFPTTHYLASLVQTITLGAILFLRCIAYVNQPELVSSIFSDAEKCISVLESVEFFFPASKICREIVTDLLIVVKTKQYGGLPAIEALQAAHRSRMGNGSISTGGLNAAESLSRGKRKNMADVDLPPASRRRLEDEMPSNWDPVPSNKLDRSDSSATSQGRSGDLSNGRYHQRLSSLRTSVEDAGGPTSPIQLQPPQPPPYPDIPQNPNPQFLQTQPLQNLMSPRGPDAHEIPSKEHSTMGFPPQVASLDLNSLSVIGLDGTSGYEYLEEELSLVLENVVKPRATSISAQTLEENARVLWQAYQTLGKSSEGS